MRMEEQLVKRYLEEHYGEITSIVSKAYIEGYNQGLKKAREINIDGIRYYDLGLPSGTLWSAPIRVKHPNNYAYDRDNYCNVSNLELPTVEDFDELRKYCMVSINPANVEQSVVITGPSGERIEIGTKDYLNDNSNPNSMLCRRLGEGVAKYTNMFWLKSDIDNNHAAVCMVNYIDKTLTLSSYFTGYKLPYILIKRMK